MWEAAKQVAISRATGSNLAGLDIADFVFENVFRRYVPELFLPCMPLPAKAGEFYIFTSSLVHGSNANVTDRSRFAIGGRYTTTDVRVMPDWEHATDAVHFAPMVVKVPVSELGVTLVHGTDKLGLNHEARLRFEHQS
jgi:ectoine hydroxylase-related dioxygenase (phytanoyl-CoA dioxygenase family)